MATQPAIQFFDRVLGNDTMLVDINPVLEVIRPHWTHADVIVEPFSKGYVNSMSCVYQKGDTDRRDALVVRIHGFEPAEYPELPAIDRRNEFLCMQLAQAAGCFPPIFAAFTNGVVYQYAPGRTLNYHDFTDPNTIRKITRKLQAFHQVNVDEVPLVDCRGNPTSISKEDRSCRVTRFMAAIPEKVTDPATDLTFQELRTEFTDVFLRDEFRKIKDVFDEIELPISLSHNDFHNDNMIIDDDTGDITIIDYEFAGFNKSCNDLTELFLLRPIYEFLGRTSVDDPQITAAVRELWLRSYLEAKHESIGGSCCDVTDKELELLNAEIEIKEISNIFYHLVSGLCLVNLPTSFDFLALIRVSSKRYYERREHLAELKVKYLKLRENIGEK